MEHQEEEPQEVTEDGPIARFLLAQPGAQRVARGVINVPKRETPPPARPAEPFPTEAMGGGDAELTITLRGQVVMSGTLETMTLKADLADDGEILRYLYEPTSFPEDDDEVPADKGIVWARLIIQRLDRNGEPLQ